MVLGGSYLQRHPVAGTCEWSYFPVVPVSPPVTPALFDVRSASLSVSEDLSSFAIAFTRN